MFGGSSGFYEFLTLATRLRLETVSPKTRGSVLPELVISFRHLDLFVKLLNDYAKNPDTSILYKIENTTRGLRRRPLGSVSVANSPKVNEQIISKIQLNKKQNAQYRINEKTKAVAKRQTIVERARQKFFPNIPNINE
jgi:hypothetical protein